MLGPATAATSPQNHSIPSDGSVVTANVGIGDHLITVSGTFVYRSGGDNHDGAYGFGTDGTCADLPQLGLRMDGLDPWNHACDDSTHTYLLAYRCAATSCTIKFHIADDHYSDNSGVLDITIRPGVADAFPVYSAITPAVTRTLAAGSYVFHVSGTFSHRWPSGDTHDAAYAFGTDGQCANLPAVGLRIDMGDPWVSDCNPPGKASSHTYNYGYTCESLCVVSFQIADDDSSDNDGFLTVAIVS